MDRHPAVFLFPADAKPIAPEQMLKRFALRLIEYNR
jgi:hypothetical protein